MKQASTLGAEGIRRMAAVRAHLGLRRLLSTDHPAATQIASALERTIEGSIGPSERALLDRIEAIRARQENDAVNTVDILDFGAGSPSDVRSETQAAEGVKATKTIQQVTRDSKPEFWSRFLYELACEVRPEKAIEMGTCLGVSACYQAAALERNGSGSLITMEGAPSLASASQTNIEECGLDHRIEIVCGRFAETLGRTLDRFSPLDYAFIDGHHDEAATVAYFEQMLPFFSPNAVVIFDDIGWTDGMGRAWRHLANHPRVGLAVDLRVVGICVLGGEAKDIVRIPTKGL